MGNEASQEGEEMPLGAQGGPGPGVQRGPPLISQQSMPLPGGVPPSPPGGSRRSSIQLMRRTSSAGTASVAPPVPAGPKRGSIVDMPAPELDLSNLSEEERATILSVMARAQSMEEEPPPLKREEEPPPPPSTTTTRRRGSITAQQSICDTRGADPSPPPSQPKQTQAAATTCCALCRVSPLTNESSSQCVECSATVCKKCSTAIPSGKKRVWMCIRCAENYPQLPAAAKSQSTVSERESTPYRDERESELRKQDSTQQPISARAQPGQPPPGGSTPGRSRSGSLTFTQDKASPHPQQQPQRPAAPQFPQQPRPQHPGPTHPVQQSPQRTPYPQHPPQQHRPPMQHPSPQMPRQQLQQRPPPPQSQQYGPQNQQLPPHQQQQMNQPFSQQQFSQHPQHSQQSQYMQSSPQFQQHNQQQPYPPQQHIQQGRQNIQQQTQHPHQQQHRHPQPFSGKGPQQQSQQQQQTQNTTQNVSQQQMQSAQLSNAVQNQDHPSRMMNQQQNQQQIFQQASDQPTEAHHNREEPNLQHPAMQRPLQQQQQQQQQQQSLHNVQSQQQSQQAAARENAGKVRRNQHHQEPPEPMSSDAHRDQTSHRQEEKPTNNSSPRAGTNPFRSDTNPFRNGRQEDPCEEDSFPARNHRIPTHDELLNGYKDDTREHRKGQAKEPPQNVQEKREAVKVVSLPEESKRVEPSESEKEAQQRQREEEQRRNAVNAGSSETTSRRQLPAIDKNRQKKHLPETPPTMKSNVQVPQSERTEQQKLPPPVKLRTSHHQDKPPEGRNGQTCIPRTIPLTSVTLQQHMQSQPIDAPMREPQSLPTAGHVKEAQHLVQQQMQDQTQPKESDNAHRNQWERDRYQEGKGVGEDVDKLQQGIYKPSLQHVDELTRINPVLETGYREGYREGTEKSSEQAKYPEEEEEDVDDYFKLIENAICVRKPQVVLGVKRSTDIQKQLLSKESNRDQDRKQVDNHVQRKGHVVSAVKQLDLYNQNQPEERASKSQAGSLDHPQMMLGSDEQRLHKHDQHVSAKRDAYGKVDDYDDGYVNLKKDAQYIIPPPSTDPNRQHLQSRDPTEESRSKFDEKPATATPYDKLLMHQLAADTRQPSAKHYLEEHKTQPVSYEAFSSAKALQQTQRRASEPTVLGKGRPEDRYSHPEAADKDSKKLAYSLGLIGDNLASHKPPQQESQYYYSQASSTCHQSAPKQTEADDQQKPGAIDLQGGKKGKPLTKPDPHQDWSPVSDLSPIIDVSPSVEAAEQELMKKFQEKSVLDDYDDDDLLGDDDEAKLIKGGGIPRATSGTISGMLEEFTRALGLPGTSPVDDSGIKTAVSPTSLAISPISVGSSMTATSSLQKEYQDTYPRGTSDTPYKQSAVPIGAGSPQKTLPQKDSQPTTPRRTHRRLPQPTVEQMQAAVAMAAQGPRERSASTGSVLQHIASASFAESSVSDEIVLCQSVSAAPATSTARPVSPMMSSWKSSSETGQPLDQVFRAPSGSPMHSATSASNAEVSSDQKTAARHQRSAQSVHGTMKLTEALVSSSCSSSVPTSNASGLSQDLGGAAHTRRLRSSSYSGSTGEVKLKDDAAVAPLNGRSVLNGSSSPSLYMSGNAVVATTEGSPQTPSTPRDKGGDSSDTQSEAESVKSVRLRRKLPSLPADERSSPSPTRRSLERNRTPPAVSDEAPESFVANRDHSFLMQESSESLKTVTSPSLKCFAPAVSDVASEETTTSASQPLLAASQQVPGSLSPSREASARSPSPSLVARDGGKAEAVSPSGTMLPQYMQSLKQQLRDELKAVTEERKVMLEHRKDRDLSAPTGGLSLIQSANRQILQKRLDEDDITIMTTATSTVVSSTTSPKLYDNKNAAVLQPPRKSTATTASPLSSYSAVTTAISTVVSFPQTNTASLSNSASSGSLTAAAVALRRQQQLAARASPQTTPKRARRRHTSEIAMPPFVQMRDEYVHHHQQQQRTPVMGMQTLQHPPSMYSTQQYMQQRNLQMQQQAGYKSMEFEALDGHVRHVPGAMVALRSSNRYGGSLGGLGPTETYYYDMAPAMGRQKGPYFSGYIADNRVMDQRIVGPDAYFQTLNNEINKLRRSSESIHMDPLYGGGTAWGDSYAMGGQQVPDIRMSPVQTTERRKKKEKKIRKPRSWQPSPYVSEDEDDQLTREEKKAKIKAEIARRRQQIEENMRLHDELVKLANQRRDRPDASGHSPGFQGYPPTATEMMYSPAQQQQPPPPPLQQRSTMEVVAAPASEVDNSDDTSSVLKAIDEILRKDLYSGPLSRAAWATYNQPAADIRTNVYAAAPPHAVQGPTANYYTIPRSRYEYSAAKEQPETTSWYGVSERPCTSPSLTNYFPEPCAEDESIERIASTFPTDEPPDILLSANPAGQTIVAGQHPSFRCDLSPTMPLDADLVLLSEHDATPAMPLLPDMPTRSRKLLENLGSSPLQPSRSGSAQSIYSERLDGEQDEESVGMHGGGGGRESQASTLTRTSRKSSRGISKSQKYDFPVKRILLTRDPKDRSVSGNGLGMKVVGGKEVPGSNGIIGAYVAKIFPGGVVETLGEVKEGDQVLEWNGIPLTGRTYEEVQRIIASSADEVEIVIRCDLNMLESVNQHRKSAGTGTYGSRSSGLDPPDGPRGGGNSRGGGSPRAQSPYSPVGSRGGSPGMNSKRMMSSGGGGDSGAGGGGNTMSNGSVGGVQQGMVLSGLSSGTSLSHSGSLHDNELTPEVENDTALREQQSLIAYGDPPSEWMTLLTSSDCLLVHPPPPHDHHHPFSSSSSDWPDIYDGDGSSLHYYGSHSPDDYVMLRDDGRQTYWRSESDMEDMQVQVACGPRAALMYMPVMSMKPLPSAKSNNSYIAQPLLTERASFARRSLDHIPDYQSIVKSSSPLWHAPELVSVGRGGTQRHPLGLGVFNYDLLQAKAKVSLHLNGLRGKGLSGFPPFCKLAGKNGHRYQHIIEDIEIKREDDRSSLFGSSAAERPRAPSDLPGLRPVFVNDWKRHQKKNKDEESDDNNNNKSSVFGEQQASGACSKKKRRSSSSSSRHNVGSSPEASSSSYGYFFPRGCKGSFCVLL